MLKKLLIIPLLLSAVIASATFTPVPLTGFNADLVANGSGPSTASVNVATGFDGGGYAFVAQDFSGGTAAPLYYLPNSGTVNSLNTSGLSYQLESYSANNVLQLSTSGSSGTLTFITPQANVSKLYILGTSGSGTSTFTVTVNYVGGATTSFTGRTYADWYSGTAAVTGIGRVKMSNNALEGSTTTPRLYQISLDVAANYFTPIESVTITKTTATGRLGVFAISADDAICSGQPNAGTASAPASVCPNANFSLTATGYSTDPGTTLQWQSSPAGMATWTSITGATTASYTVTGGISAATDYQLVTSCFNGGGSSSSNVVSVGLSFCYCNPTYTSGCTNWRVTNVTSGSFTHSPTGTCTVNNYTAQSLTVIAGVSTPISVSTLGFVAMGIAADFNVDADFNDQDEILSLPAYIATSPATYSVNITVPASVAAGSYRMRVWCRQANAGPGNPADSPCGTYAYGNFVDYTINVISSSNCTGQPAVPVATGPASTCPNTNFNLASTGATAGIDITYQWQSSATGMGNWTNIANATNQNYTVTGGITSSTDFQLITTCGSNGSISTSNVVTVPTILCYCSPSYTSGCTSWRVTNVTQGSFTHSPSGTCTNSNYLTQTISIPAGATVPMSVTTMGFVAMGIAADFNTDGDFNDQDEVLSLPVYFAANPSTYSVTISIPASIAVGNYRLRIWCRLANAGNGSPADSPCGTYGYGNFIDYTLSVTNQPVCSGQPATPVASGPASVCSNASVALTATGASTEASISYQWQSSPAGAGTWTNIANATNVNYTVTGGITSDMDYQLITTCAVGGATSTSNVVTVALSNPTIVTTTPGSACAGSSATLSATGSVGSTLNWYSLATGGTLLATGGSFTTPAITSTTDYYVAAMSTAGCESAHVPVTATVVPSLVPSVTANASANNVCAGTSISFTATPTNGGATPGYQWMVNGGNVAGATNATYTSSTLANNDVVSVQMTSSSACANPTTATSNSVTMMLPTPTNTTTNASACVSYTWAANGQQYTQSGTYTVTSACATQTLNLVIKQPTTATVTVSAPGSYTWHNQTYATSGTYTWVGTNAAGCDSTVTLNLTIVPGCAPTSSTESVTACGSYTWHGTTYTSSTNTATWGTTNAAGCDSTITLNLVITSTTSNTTTATACGSYTWAVNGQTYTQSGNYTVVSGCNTEILALTINAAMPPTITPDGPTTICSTGGSVVLTASAGASYQWNTSDVSQSITAMSGGTYTVTVTSVNGCVGQASIVVSSKAMPAAAKIKVVGSATVCAPSEVAYVLDMPMGSTTGFGYQWKQNGTAIPGATDSIYSADATGAYTVTISGGSSCSKTSGAKTATVKALPTADFTVGGVTEFCAGGTVTFTAAQAGTGATYAWLKNGSSNAGSGATKTFNASGEYSLVVTLAGCKDTSDYAEVVTVYPMPPIPKVAAVGSTTVCAPNEVHLTLDPTVSSMGSSFQWNVGGSPIAGANDSTYDADASGSYSLTLTTTNGCTKTSSVKVATVKPLPVADFSAGGPTEFCAGGQVVFTAPTMTGYTYTWLKDGVNAGSGTSKTFKVAGVYTVVATLAGCKDTADYTETIVVNPLPVAAVSTMDPATFCAGSYATIVATPSGAGYTYAWYKTNVLDAGNTSDNYMATLAGTYKAMVTDDKGCVSKISTTSVVVKVNPIPVATITPVGSTTIASNGNVKLKAAPATAGHTYQWYLDGVAISGATGKEHIATVGGDYIVEVTKLGCMGTSAITTVTQTSVKEEEGTTSNPMGTEEASAIFELSAFPNPVSGILNVNVRGIEEVDATLQVMDMNGKLVAEKNMREASATVDMTGYANGMYLIRYKDNQGRTGTIKVNKQ